MQKGIKNELKLMVFSALVGGFAGIVFWLFLFAVQRGTWLVWEALPQGVTGSVWYSVAACALGGLLCGLLRLRWKDLPESMDTVLGKLRRDGTYAYDKLPIILVAALLPLMFGSSVGPEAGMVGVVVALCCWAGENLRFAGGESAYYSKVGASVSLSVMFYSPLFGVFDVEEGEGGGLHGITRSRKIVVYGIAVGAGFGCITLLNGIFGDVMTGFPSFAPVTEDWRDVALFFPYVLCGIMLGVLFNVSEHGFERVGKLLPPVLGEVVAGIVLGLVTGLAPAVRFSGEDQMGALISGSFAQYAPVAIIGIGLLKVVLTNLCIGMGLKGGHFFPLIFAAVCLGMGLSLVIFAGDLSHATIAAGIVAAATLGTTMRKPMAVAMLLLLCFPARMLMWTIPAAACAVWVVGLVHKPENE